MGRTFSAWEAPCLQEMLSCSLHGMGVVVTSPSLLMTVCFHHLSPKPLKVRWGI